MNKLSRLLVGLVLGTSSLAMAQPVAGPLPPTPAPQVYTGQVYGGPSDASTFRPGGGWNEGRWNRRPQMPTYLGSGQLAYGRTKLAVSSPMRFQKLQLAATSGFLSVNRLTIVFADGERQVVNLDARLGRNSAPVTIDLDGRGARQIASVRVTGRGSYGSMFSITGV